MTVKPAQWKKCRLMWKPSCTVLFRYSFLIRPTSYYYNAVQPVNTILLIYGPIPAAATRVPVKKPLMQPTGDCRKKWELPADWNTFLTSSTKQNWKMG